MANGKKDNPPTDTFLDLHDLDTIEEPDLYSEYNGPILPRNIIITGQIKIWLVRTENNQRALKVLVIADTDNPEFEKYNGHPIWDQIPLTNPAKFRWHALMRAIGVTPTDLVNKTTFGEESPKGYPILAIGKVDIASAQVTIKTRYETYDDEKYVKIKSFFAQNGASDRLNSDDEPPF